MLGFDLDLWDYLTFLTIFLSVVSGVLVFIWLAGLPGRIAIARNHPEAEAVKLLGWAGLLPTVYPWVQAFIWAFKPTDKVDIRRFPRAEAIANAAEIARLKGEPPPLADERDFASTDRSGSPEPASHSRSAAEGERP